MRKIEINGQTFRITAKGGYIWASNKIINKYICPFCKETHHEYIDDLTPFVPYHPQNTRLPDQIMFIKHPIACNDCSSVSAWIKRMIKKIKGLKP